MLTIGPVHVRLAIGGGYRADFDLVFAKVGGEPVRPRRLTRQFDTDVKAAGLPRIRLHDLRYTRASQMLSAGVPRRWHLSDGGRSSIAVARRGARRGPVVRVPACSDTMPHR